MSPLDVVPEDIEIGVKHFLSVPMSTDFDSAMHHEDKTHRIVKLTKERSGFEIEHIDTKSQVSSEYFTTTNFVGKSLCHITTTAGSDEYQCLHSSVKKFYVTQRNNGCPHLKFNLCLFCVCESAEIRFRERLRDIQHKQSPVMIEHDIKKDMNVDFSLDICIQEGEWEELKKRIAHEKLCKYNGMLYIGQVKQAFNCSCKEGKGCQKPLPIEIRVRQEGGGQIEEPTECGGQLYCDCRLTPPPNERTSLEEILLEEIPRPHRPGKRLSFSIRPAKNSLSTDLAENLAYSLDFGESFKIWLNDNPRVGAREKVILNCVPDSQFSLSQARQFFRSWQSAKGAEATAAAMVEALERLPLTQDIIDKIKSNCF